MRSYDKFTNYISIIISEFLASNQIIANSDICHKFYSLIEKIYPAFFTFYPAYLIKDRNCLVSSRKGFKHAQNSVKSIHIRGYYYKYLVW